MATPTREELGKVSLILSKFIRSVEKSKPNPSTGKISMIDKHTKKHVVSEEEFKQIILEKYKIDMSL